MSGSAGATAPLEPTTPLQERSADMSRLPKPANVVTPLQKRVADTTWQEEQEQRQRKFMAKLSTNFTAAALMCASESDTTRFEALLKLTTMGRVSRFAQQWQSLGRHKRRKRSSKVHRLEAQAYAQQLERLQSIVQTFVQQSTILQRISEPAHAN